MAAGINCAFTQVYAGLDIGGMKAGDNVVIQGAGGLGVYACAVAREMGAGKVVVIDGVDERLELASEFGADEFVDLRQYNTPAARIDRVKAAHRRLGRRDRDGAGRASRRGGRGPADDGARGHLLEIGNINVGWEATFDPSWIIFGNRRIQGVAHYEAEHLKAALDLMIRTKTKYPYHKILSHKFPLEQINEAFRQQEDGHITRGAIVPS